MPGEGRPRYIRVMPFRTLFQLLRRFISGVRLGEYHVHSSLFDIRTFLQQSSPSRRSCKHPEPPPPFCYLFWEYVPCFEGESLSFVISKLPYPLCVIHNALHTSLGLKFFRFGRSVSFLFPVEVDASVPQHSPTFPPHVLGCTLGPGFPLIIPFFPCSRVSLGNLPGSFFSPARPGNRNGGTRDLFPFPFIRRKTPPPPP